MIKLKNNFLNKLTENFRDCYGMDRLSKYAFLTGAVLTATYYLSPLGIALMGYSTWRSFSKNKYKRYRELEALNRVLFSLKESVNNKRLALGGGSQYKIFKCPNCSQKLRVPRRHGRIVITCKKCGTEFKGKS
ncbi:MAG: hypothetical protein Q8930_06875 [Bacillota bacterium]|nr:hypothetical protein [Bacillota bacterium]